jgi:hypothetical protein
VPVVVPAVAQAAGPEVLVVLAPSTAELEAAAVAVVEAAVEVAAAVVAAPAVHW